MYTIIGKHYLHGVYSSGEPYDFFRVYCTVSPSEEEVRNGFEGLKTKAFNFNPNLFKTVSIGEIFNEPLFNDARFDRDRCVQYLVKD